VAPHGGFATTRSTLPAGTAGRVTSARRRRTRTPARAAFARAARLASAAARGESHYRLGEGAKSIAPPSVATHRADRIRPRRGCRRGVASPRNDDGGLRWRGS
jgi:hypothetical protein